MKELVTLWSNTRMVAFTALCAALYAAVLIPFKVGIPLIPGLTEVRPANALPIVCSLLFGPAAAWGAAFGNLIADFFGTLTAGSAFGFLGNFLYGYIPYRAWRALARRGRGSEPEVSSRRWLRRVLLVSLLASLTCALIIAWGVHLLGLFPFGPFAVIISANNFLVSALLAPPLLLALYPRVRRWGLLYDQVMREKDLSPGRFSLLGQGLLWFAVVAGLALGCFISFGLRGVPMVGKAGEIAALAGGGEITLGLLPAIALVLIACALL
jgi:energy-coupling factor transport system substrate-specific component